MILFTKFAIAAVTVITSLMGFRQVTTFLEIKPFLTLPAYEHLRPFLAAVGLRPFELSLAVNQSDSWHHTITNSSTPGDFSTPFTSSTASKTVDFTTFSSSIISTPVVFHSNPLLPTAFVPSDQCLENVGSPSNAEASSSRNHFMENLASFDTIIDYLFSFVAKRPTTPLAALQFVFVAVFVVGCVSFMGASVYWILHLLDLRDQSQSRTTGLFPDSTEPVLAALHGEDNDALLTVSRIIDSVAQNISVDENKASIPPDFPLEILVSAAESAQVYSDLIKEELRVEIRESTENIKSEIELGRRELGNNLRQELIAAIKGQGDQVGKVQSKLDSKAGSDVVSRLDAKLQKVIDDTKAAFEDKLKAIVKGNRSRISDLESKLDAKFPKVTAHGQLGSQDDIYTAIQISEIVGAEALAHVDARVVSQDKKLCDVLCAFAEVKSELKKLETVSSKQRSENGILLRKIDEKQKEHHAEVLRVTAEANRLVANVSTELKNALEKKADTSACTTLEEKLTKIENGLEGKLSSLSTALATTETNLKSKAEIFDAKLEKQQEDLGTAQVDFRTQLANFNTQVLECEENCTSVKKALNSKADHMKLSKEIDHKLAGFVKSKKLKELSDQVDTMSEQIASNTSNSSAEEVRQVASSLAKVDQQIAAVNQALSDKVNASTVASLVTRLDDDASAVAALAARVDDNASTITSLSIKVNDDASDIATLTARVYSDAGRVTDMTTHVESTFTNLIDHVAKNREALAGVSDQMNASAAKLETCFSNLSGFEKHLSGKVAVEEFEKVKQDVDMTRTQLVQQQARLAADASTVESHKAKEAIHHAENKPNAEMQILAAVSSVQTEPTVSDMNTDSICNLTITPDVPSSPLGSVNVPSGQSVSLNASTTKFDVPAIKIDPVAAEQGKRALMQSRFAIEPRQSSPAMTTVSRPSVPIVSSDAVRPAHNSTVMTSHLLKPTAHTFQPRQLLQTIPISPNQPPTLAVPVQSVMPKYESSQRFEQPSEKLVPKGKPSVSLGDSKWSDNAAYAESSTMKSTSSLIASPAVIPSAIMGPATAISPAARIMVSEELNTQIPTAPGQTAKPLLLLGDSKWAGDNPAAVSNTQAPSKLMASRWADLSATPEPVSRRAASDTQYEDANYEAFTGSNGNAQNQNFNPYDSDGDMTSSNLSRDRIEKVRKYPLGNGPGANGGQRACTPNARAHNSKRGVTYQINKALRPFTEAQQNHARSFQTGGGSSPFAVHCPWSWLNPIVYQGLTAYQVRPPPGWRAPNCPPLTTTTTTAPAQTAGAAAANGPVANPS